MARGPVHATVALPGSKSMTNRALVLGALAQGPSTLIGPLSARDTALMTAGLRVLGVVVDQASDVWVVEPGPLRGGGIVDVGNAGTVMRFLLPVAALADGPVTFDGDRRARERPLAPLIEALRHLGVEIDDGGRGGLPLTVNGTGRLDGGKVAIDASASSQFVSALLLVGARCRHGLTVVHEGPPVPSVPHIGMTVSMVRDAGGVVDGTVERGWRVEPGPLGGRRWVVEPDLSNAAPFLAAAVVTEGTVRIPGWPLRTSQPGDRLRQRLAAMGAVALVDEQGLTLRGLPERPGLVADLREEGELVPVLAAVAALAATPSELRGTGHLRHHETDRLAALARNLAALGADVTEQPDGLAIRPVPLHGGLFRTYDDHRLAMAGAVVGLRVPEVVLDDVATTAKTLPGFAGMWTAMLRGGAG